MENKEHDTLAGWICLGKIKAVTHHSTDKKYLTLYSIEIAGKARYKVVNKYGEEYMVQTYDDPNRMYDHCAGDYEFNFDE